MYKFSESFYLNDAAWLKHLANYRHQAFPRYLELGVAQGQSMVWMLENILTHPDSRATGIDNFSADEELQAAENILTAGGKDRVELVRDSFSSALKGMEKESFDIIYHDGGHVSWMTLESLALAWPLLKEGGVMIIDDYFWSSLPVSDYGKKIAIDSFLACYRGFLEILHIDNQLLLRKISHISHWSTQYSFPLSEWSYDPTENSLNHWRSKKSFVLSPVERTEILGILSQPSFLEAKDATERRKVAENDTRLEIFLADFFDRGQDLFRKEPSQLPKIQATLPNIQPKFPPQDQNEIFQWAFGEKGAKDFISGGSSNFHCRFHPSIPRKKYDFKEEIYKAVQRIDQKRNGKPVALCFTGGKDSSLIAQVLAELSIPFDLYFLNNWRLNQADLMDRAIPYASRISKEINVVNLSREFFFEEFVPRSFEEFGCEAPTNLALLFLFEQIPKTEYIVVGAGDFERQGDLFLEIGSRITVRKPTSFPFAASDVLYSNWSEKRNRPGEFRFFSSTPELMAATFTSPKFQLDFPFSSTREVYREAFPKIPLGTKSTNWDSFHGFQDNQLIRRRLKNLAKTLPGFSSWRPAMGATCALNDLFY